MSVTRRDRRDSRRRNHAHRIEPARIGWLDVVALLVVLLVLVVALPLLWAPTP